MNINDSLSYVKEHGRKLDYLLIKNLTENVKSELLEELLKYQNSDGGFGNALEPDAQLPHSSVLATNIAIEIIEGNNLQSDELIQSICNYLISQFDEKNEVFHFVPEEVDLFPHAVWWNYEGLKSFGKFNPTPEVLGFLYKYKHLHSFNIEVEVSKLVDKIKSEFVANTQEHSLYSVIKFMEFTSNKEISEIVNNNIEELITLKEEEWKQYTPEPYKLISPEHSLYKKYEDAYKRNIEFIKSTQKNGVWYPEWSWYQFDDVFESTAKHQWMGYITYNKLKLLKKNEG